MSAEKILISKADACVALSISRSSLEMLIRTGSLRARRLGARVLIHRDELERYSKSDHRSIWPPKRNGKTTRDVSRASL